MPEVGRRRHHISLGTFTQSRALRPLIRDLTILHAQVYQLVSILSQAQISEQHTGSGRGRYRWNKGNKWHLENIRDRAAMTRSVRTLVRNHLLIRPDCFERDLRQRLKTHTSQDPFVPSTDVL